MHTKVDPTELSEAEAHFRAMAFRILYNRVLANVGNLTTRFACAIAYSAREINDPHLYRIWWSWTGGRSVKGLLAAGKKPPHELRPFVESYLQALGERAQQTGDAVAELV